MHEQEMVAAAADTADPRRGLRALSSLRVLLESLELRQVEAALRAGMSWQEIADGLGVTRQAVHRKYSRRIDADIPVPRRRRR
jgi:DNA invertase Pin-like site-specific DNA recombinase